jgi:allophanate hydrolase
VLFDASAATIGVPSARSIQTFGDRVQEADFRRSVDRMSSSGATIRELDFSPFYAVARMLYEGGS